MASSKVKVAPFFFEGLSLDFFRVSIDRARSGPTLMVMVWKSLDGIRHHHPLHRSHYLHHYQGGIGTEGAAIIKSLWRHPVRNAIQTPSQLHHVRYPPQLRLVFSV